MKRFLAVLMTLLVMVGGSCSAWANGTPSALKTTCWDGYAKPYVDYAYDYWYPYVMELYNYLHTTIVTHKELAAFVGLLILYLPKQGSAYTLDNPHLSDLVRGSMNTTITSTGFASTQLGYREHIQFLIRFFWEDNPDIELLLLLIVLLIDLSQKRQKYLVQLGTSFHSHYHGRVSGRYMNLE